MKILIVDDSRAMRQIVARTLRRAGYEGHDTPTSRRDLTVGVKGYGSGQPSIISTLPR